MKGFFRFRYIQLLLASLLVFAAKPLLAQEVQSGVAPVKKWLLKTAPIHLEEINASFEYLCKPDRSLQFGVGYLHSSHLDDGAVGEPVSYEVDGFSLKLSQRTYSKGGRFTPPQGSYRGPLLTYRYMAFPERVQSYYQSGSLVSTSNYRFFQQVVSVQYLWGKQRIAWNWLVIDGYIGVGGRVKYAWEKGGDPNEDMHGGLLYGEKLAAGPDWVVLFGPSVSINLAIGVALK